MNTIEERAKEYEESLGFGYRKCMSQFPSDAFIAGAKSEREELTRWHNPNEELPDEYKLVIIKYTRVTGYIYYAVAYICRLNEFDGERTVWRVSDADYLIKLNSVIGWREIYK